VRWSNVEWLLGAIERFEAKHPAASATRWSELLASVEQPRDQESEAKLDGVVTLSTFHSAKGLEWPYVFIVGCEEGIMPHKRVEAPRINDAIAGDIEEERRLFYVGVTRARDELFLTRAKMRVDRGREVECLPSRFLAELPESELKIHDVQSQEKLTPEAMDELANAFLAKLGTS
jgi:DNA helicase-2/ATP-dependent DNA helicase PcrA